MQKDVALAHHNAEVSAVLQDSKHQQDLRMEDGRSRTQLKLRQMDGVNIPPEPEEDPVVAQVKGIQEGLQALAEMIGQLGKIVTAPRVPERDKSGRPVASRVVLE